MTIAHFQSIAAYQGSLSRFCICDEVLRVCINLFVVFGPKRDEVTGEWRRLHNEELHNLYSPPDIIRQVKANEVGGACGTHGRGEKSVQDFDGKAQRKETTWKTKA
jgi:hypothetical protein